MIAFYDPSKMKENEEQGKVVEGKVKVKRKQIFFNVIDFDTFRDWWWWLCVPFGLGEMADQRRNLAFYLENWIKFLK